MCGSLKRKGGACFAYAGGGAAAGQALALAAPAKVKVAKVNLAIGGKR